MKTPSAIDRVLKPQPKKELLQAHVPADLLEEVRELKVEIGATWDDIITACLQDLIDKARK